MVPLCPPEIPWLMILFPERIWPFWIILDRAGFWQRFGGTDWCHQPWLVSPCSLKRRSVAMGFVSPEWLARCKVVSKSGAKPWWLLFSLMVGGMLWLVNHLLYDVLLCYIDMFSREHNQSSTYSKHFLDPFIDPGSPYVTIPRDLTSSEPQGDLCSRHQRLWEGWRHTYNGQSDGYHENMVCLDWNLYVNHLVLEEKKQLGFCFIVS